MDPIKVIQQNLRAAATPTANNNLAQSILQQVRARVVAARESQSFDGGPTGALSGYYLDEASIDALAKATGGDKVKAATAEMFRGAMQAWQTDPSVFGGRTPADFVNAKVRARLAAVRSEEEQDAARFSTPGLVGQTAADLLMETPLRLGYDLVNLAEAAVGRDTAQPSALFATSPERDPIVQEARRGNVPGGQFSRALVGTRAINEGNRPEQASFFGYLDETTGEYIPPDASGAFGKYLGSGVNLLYKAAVARGALNAVGVTGALAPAVESLGASGRAGAVLAGGLEQLPTMVTLGALNRVQQTPRLTAALDPVSVLRDDVVNSFIAGGMERLLLSSVVARNHKGLQRALAEVGGETDDLLLAGQLLDNPVASDLIRKVGVSEELRTAVREVAPRFLREYGAANVASPIAEFVAGYTADRLRGEDYESAIANGLFFGMFDAAAARGRMRATTTQTRKLMATARREYSPDTRSTPINLNFQWARRDYVADPTGGVAEVQGLVQPADPARVNQLEPFLDVPGAESVPRAEPTPASVAPDVRFRAEEFDQYGMPRPGVTTPRDEATGFVEAGYAETQDARTARLPMGPAVDLDVRAVQPRDPNAEPQTTLFTEEEVRRYNEARWKRRRGPLDAVRETGMEAGDALEVMAARRDMPPSPPPAPVELTKPLEAHSRAELQRIASRLGIPSRTATKATLVQQLRESGAVKDEVDPATILSAGPRARRFTPAAARLRATAAQSDPNSLAQLVTETPKKLTTVLERASRLIGAPIRHNRAGTTSGAAGQFSGSGVMVKYLNAPELLAHEIGHGLLTNVLGRNAIPEDVRAELVSWADRNIEDIGAGDLLHEGYATYTALRAIRPQEADALFPATTRFHETAFNARTRRLYADTMQDIGDMHNMGGAAWMAAMTANRRAFYRRIPGLSQLVGAIFRADVAPARAVDTLRDEVGRVTDEELRADLLRRVVDPVNDPTKQARIYSRSAASSYLSVNYATAGDGVGGVVNPDTGVIPGSPSVRTAAAPARENAREIVRRMRREGYKPKTKTTERIVDLAFSYVGAKRAVELFDRVADGERNPVDIPGARVDPATGVQDVEMLRQFVTDFDAKAQLDDGMAESLIASTAKQVAKNMVEFTELQFRESLRSVGMEHLLDNLFGRMFTEYLPQAKFDPEHTQIPLWDRGRLVEAITGNTGMVANGAEALMTRLSALHSQVVDIKRGRALLNFARLEESISAALEDSGVPAKSRKRDDGTYISIVDEFAGVDLVEKAAKVEEALRKIDPGIDKAEVDRVLANPESWAFFIDMTGDKSYGNARRNEIVVYDEMHNRPVTLRLGQDWADFYFDSSDMGDSNSFLKAAHWATSLTRLGATGLNLTFAAVDPVRNAMAYAIYANLGLRQYGADSANGLLGTAVDTVLGTPLRFGNALLRSYGALVTSGLHKVLPETTAKAYDARVQSAADAARAYLAAPLGKVLRTTPAGRRLDRWAQMTFGQHADFNPLSFDTLGGAMSGFLGPDPTSVEVGMRAVLRDTGLTREVLHTAAEVFTRSELAPKNAAMREYYSRLRDAGYDHTRATQIAYLEAKDVQDFQYTNMTARLMNKLTPYFSAQLVGVDKAYRTMFQPFMRKATGKAPSKVTRAEAAKAWARAFSMVTIPSLFEWLLNKDKEWWRETPEEQRYNYWHLSADDGDTVVRIPKLHELGMLFGTVPVSLIDSYYKRADEISETPQQFRRALVASVANLIPGDWFDPSVRDGIPFSPLKGLVSLSPTVITPLWEASVNQSSFTGRPIVPDNMRDNLLPEDQTRDYVSRLANEVGDMLGTSPLVIEHIVNSYSGGMYRRLSTTFSDSAELFRWFLDGESEETYRSQSPLSLAARLSPVVNAFYREGPYYRETESERWLHDVNRDVSQILGSFEQALERGDRERALRLLPRIPANYAAFPELQSIQSQIRQIAVGDRERAAQLRRRLTPVFRSAVLEYQRNLEND